MFGKILSSAASLIPGVGSSILGRQMDISSARDAREWQGEQAGIAYDRSMDAYKSRYQHTVADMKAAGLNPILAATGGFQVGPSVNAMMPPAAPMPSGNYLQNVVSSAKDYAQIPKIEKEVENVSEDTKLKGAQILKMQQEIRESIQNVATKRAQENLMEADEKLSVARVDDLASQISKRYQEIENLKLERDKIREEIPRILADRKRLQQLERESRSKEAEAYAAESQLRVLTKKIKTELPKLVQTAEAYKGPVGKILGYINAIFGATNTGVGVVFKGGK